MKILISGISGFLAKHLAKMLSREHEIIGLSRKGAAHVDAYGVRIFSIEEIQEFESRPDLLVLCHAVVPAKSSQMSADVLYEGNVTYTQRIMELFPATRVIYISTVSVYGVQIYSGANEMTPVQPVNEYGKSKAIAEDYVLKNGFQPCIIRFSSIYGPGMNEDTIIPIYVNQALKDRRIVVWGDGSRKQNYINASDAVELIYAVINNVKRLNKVYLGVDDFEYSNDELATKISNLTGVNVEYFGDDFEKSVYYNNSLTKSTLAWGPNKMLETGLKEYIEWKVKQS